MDLLRLYRRGLIPGPQESHEAFQARVMACVDPKVSAELTPCDPTLLSQIKHKSLETLGFFPDWAVVHISSKQLPFWVGGCTWICEQDQVVTSYIQLQPFFAKKEAFWSTSRQELLLHEVVHLSRMAFQEPKYEEMLAYRTATKTWKRLLGPMCSERRNLLALCLSLVFPPLSLLFGDPDWFGLVSLLPWAVLLILWMQGLDRKKKLERTLIKCEALGLDKSRAQQLVYLLTDAEIEQWGSLPPQDILQQLENPKASLRQTLIAQLI